MKTIFISLCMVLSVATLSAQKKVLYDFKATSLDGQAFDFSSLKGKKVLVVNTASKCGLTPQYATLEKLYEKYKDSEFYDYRFPCQQFCISGTRQQQGDQRVLHHKLRRYLSNDVENIGQGRRHGPTLQVAYQQDREQSTGCPCAMEFPEIPDR